MKRNTAQRDRDRASIRRGHPACALCGEPIDYSLRYPHPRSFVVDHKTPLIAGGLDHLSNKQPAHRDCNRDKGARLDGGPVVRRSGSIKRPAVV